MTPRTATGPGGVAGPGEKDTEREAERLRRLLGFWNAVEVLSHFTVPSSRTANIVAIRDDGDLPWPVQPSDEWVVWYIVYLGIHPHRAAVTELLEHFRATPDADAAASRDECCLASFVVDQSGIIVPGSGVLSSHSWAMGQLAANPQLRGLPEAERSYQQRFADRHAATRCDVTAMRAEVAAVETAIDWSPSRPTEGPIAHARRVVRRRRRNAREDEAVRPESDVLSSFYLGDLARLMRVAQEPDRLPRGLRAYLSGVDVSGRRDVRRDRAAVGDAVRPGCFPAGRWPQPGGHHLALMQQVAVNRALAVETADAGIFSVNGPPGTGKTTLLRDIVAAVVVERARVMLGYGRPASAFGRGDPISAGGTSHPTHAVDARLRGFELLVASSNNGAVENLTLELPRHDAVDPSLTGGRPDPFAHLGTRLARAREGDAALAWGLIAGVLGNRDNRDLFREALWFDREASLRAELGARPPAEEWTDARSHFRVAVQKERWHRERAATAANPSRIPVDDAFWALDEEVRQLSLPWSTPSWGRARAELFVAALHLHRAFVRSAGKPIVANLAAMMEVLRQPPSGADPEALASVWTSLFLVVPVLSTTFASAARMLHGMGPESLGWALIDEAGQASPQQAAGTIWRARRTIVIGDPLQIPPVQTLATGIHTALRAEWRVPDRWDPATTSVQTVADSVTPLGTSLGTTWVGCPLRVHRRCAGPMFGISNEIAYDGAMVSATPTRTSVVGEILGESRWIDVPGVPGGGHHIQAQAVMVERMVRRLARSLPAAAMDVFVISPFRQVADTMRQRLRSLAPADDTAWRQWVHERVGTIHTAQGKEADGVILLLGGDPSIPRALLWAGATPNILNVAVSRAQERLYVVGDAAAWSTVPHFSVLYGRLRIVRPAQRMT
jgi:hypothetical protein